MVFLEFNEQDVSASCCTAPRPFTVAAMRFAHGLPLSYVKMMNKAFR